MSRKKVEASDADRELAATRVWVRVSGIPSALADVDRGAFGTTPLNLETLEALASGFAAAAAAAGLGIEGPFLAFLLTEEVLDRLAALDGSGERADPKGSLPAKQYHDLIGARKPEAMFVAVLEDCRNFLEFYRDHPSSDKKLTRDRESLNCLRSYFRLLGNTLRKLSGEPGGQQLDTPRLRFDGWRASSAELGEPSGLLPVGLDDIVGNAEVVKVGKRLVRDVAGFDVARGENPKKMRNQILFVLGTPGCGKTVTAHALLNYLLELCEKHGVPAKTRVIRRTDWASSYQNQSAQRLLEIFRDEVFNAPGVCGAYWPDIDTAFSARGDTEMRQEEKGNLGTLFGILDGTIGPKNGKWFLFCDANTLHMDEAMMSRLAQTPLKAYGPQTPADFIRLLRDIKLRGKGDWLPISEPEWTALGKRCVDEKLSGRSVDAVAGRVLTAMEDFEEPEEYFGLPFEEKKRLIGELSVKVKAEAIEGFITDHIRFEREAQEKGEEERFRRRVDEIRLHLSAQRAAVGGLVAEQAAQQKAPAADA